MGWLSHRFGRRRVPLMPAPAPRTEPRVTALHLLLYSWAGRLFIASTLLKLLVALTRRVTDSTLVDALSTVATLGLLVSLAYFLWRLFVLMKRRLLWRVRRKLILSYIFIGVVPALLIIGFVLVSANVVSMNVAAYLFKDGYDGIVADLELASEAVARQIGEQPDQAREAVGRVVENVRRRHSGIAIAFVPAPGCTAKPASSGAWEHQPPPTTVPTWTPADGFQGTVAVPGDEPGELQLVIRSVAPVRGEKGAAGTVIADLPVNDRLFDALKESTGVKAITTRFGPPTQKKVGSALQVISGAGTATGSFTFFRNSVAFLDATDWTSGTPHGATLSLNYDVGELWDRLTRAQSQRIQFAGAPLAQAFLMVLVAVAILFLIIQGVALLMGLALARSITSSIHELFTGTERVRRGDFTHRIHINTKDQLGELASSFNQMTGSIEGLLQTAAEKKRLEEELRIARQIQMSLLPRGPLEAPGLGVTALCVPAREVGGDYYDFFHLADDRLGVLIADVAGKGTSAALYMAELKGLVLGLSQIHDSPRSLLLEVNRIISENLDSRSFITMTYAVIDRRLGVMTYCRAGHTPLIYLPGNGAGGPKAAQVLTPDGMVVGLRIPGAAALFADLLEEQRVDLNVGDVVVLYTDGITEAMNQQEDLFGESRLSRIVEEHGHLGSGELRERILREIEAFVGGADQHDDMTMIVLKVEELLAPVLA